jgi:hypothetical protein
MQPTEIVITISILINIGLLALLLYNHGKELMYKINVRRQLKKAREVKKIRDEVRRYLKELQEE